jgi:hypothetical protein
MLFCPVAEVLVGQAPPYICVKFVFSVVLDDLRLYMIRGVSSMTRSGGVVSNDRIVYTCHGCGLQVCQVWGEEAEQAW